MDNILIVKTSALGDIIHVYPVVDYLRKKFPQARIDWVCEQPCIDLVTAHPSVSHAIPIATKKWRGALLQGDTYKAIRAFRKQLHEVAYDVVFDLQGNVKSGLVTAQARSKMKVGFGCDTVPERLNLLFTNKRVNPPPRGNIRQDYLTVVTSFFNDSLPAETSKVALKITEAQQKHLQSLMQAPKLSQGPKVVVCSGSAWLNKQLSADALYTFLSLVQNSLKCSFLFVWGSPAEKAAAENLHAKFSQHSEVLEKMSLSMLQNLMELSDLVIAMDSLPLHLAGTTNTPSFSVFGASLAQKYKPLGNAHGVYQGSCPYGRTFAKRCPVLRTCPTGACIRSLHGSEIFSVFSLWWKDLN